MYRNPYASAGTLELIRRTRGADACRNRFGEVLLKRKGEAVRLLSVRGLSFGTLFVLRPQIKEAGLEPQLDAGLQAALRICDQALDEKKTVPEDRIPYSDENVRAAFLWIFQTGVRDDGLNNKYDGVLDLCACVLTRRYREKSILSGLSGLIFLRNRKKGYLHDLIWAFFQIRDPASLRYLAPYLRSANARDRELARLLLHLPDAGGDARAREMQYRDFTNWLNENNAYLYFTGESLQSSNQPEICGLNRAAKYLGKQISPHSRAPIDPLTKEEEESLSCFAQAEESEKAALSDYSAKLHARNPALWNRWIHSPVSEQLSVAKSGMGRRLV